jgi:L-alanine-DL-glutamate epimerase-like enolase superfamily enzyme
MQIIRLRTEVVQIPFDPPIAAAIFALNSIDAVLTFLETDAGIVGEGIVFTVNNRRLKVIHEMICSLEPLIIGLDPALGGSVNARAWRELNFVGYEGVSILGLAGIDMALWDLRAKAASLNVAAMLGACRTAVPTYASGGLWLGHTADALQAEAADFVARGFRAMKIRLGKPDPREDVARVAALRAAVGPDIALMADANQQLSVSEAIRLGRMLEEFNLTWFEEPVICHDHAGEAAVAAALDTPIASGETVWTHRGVKRMLDARAADIMMPDLERMGGPTEFIKAGHLCEAFNVPLASHLFTEMSLPLLAAAANCAWLEHMPWFEPLYGATIPLDADGRAVVSNKPGWGYSLDPTAIRRFAHPG